MCFQTREVGLGAPAALRPPNLIRPGAELHSFATALPTRGLPHGGLWEAGATRAAAETRLRRFRGASGSGALPQHVPQGGVSGDTRIRRVSESGMARCRSLEWSDLSLFFFSATFSQWSECMLN